MTWKYINKIFMSYHINFIIYYHFYIFPVALKNIKVNYDIFFNNLFLNIIIKIIFKKMYFLVEKLFCIINYHFNCFIVL
jgi:hypothetical protein